MKPAVFIGSSTEDRRVAEAIQVLLREDADATVWKQGVFKLGKTYIESLVDELDKVDFAVLILSSVDVTISRKKRSGAPRDNVIFELGLFTGRLGRDRCYFVFDETQDLKLPTDLLGIAAEPYRPHESGNLEAALGAACTRIRSRLVELGRRPKLDPDAIAIQGEFRGFCDGVAGHWWERTKPEDASALSFVTIDPDETTGTVKMRGRAFGMDGTHVATWETVASCVKLKEKRVFYYWKGWHPGKPNEPYEGLGEISFHQFADHIDSGDGVFSDTNLTDLSSTRKKSFELRRCTEQEVQVMQGSDTGRITALIRKKLQQMA